MQIVTTSEGQQAHFAGSLDTARFLFSVYTFRGWTSRMWYTTLQYINGTWEKVQKLVRKSKKKKTLTWYNLSSLSTIYQRRYFHLDSLIDTPRVHTRSWGDAPLQSYKNSATGINWSNCSPTVMLFNHFCYMTSVSIVSLRQAFWMKRSHRTCLEST